MKRYVLEPLDVLQKVFSTLLLCALQGCHCDNLFPMEVFTAKKSLTCHPRWGQILALSWHTKCKHGHIRTLRTRVDTGLYLLQKVPLYPETCSRAQHHFPSCRRIVRNLGARIYHDMACWAILLGMVVFSRKVSPKAFWPSPILALLQHPPWLQIVGLHFEGIRLLKFPQYLLHSWDCVDCPSLWFCRLLVSRFLLSVAVGYAALIASSQ